LIEIIFGVLRRVTYHNPHTSRYRERRRSPEVTATTIRTTALSACVRGYQLYSHEKRFCEDNERDLDWDSV